MPSATTGDAILRIALAGADGGNGSAPSSPGNLTIGVNGKEVGTLHPVATNALRYNTNKGAWNQYVQKFDASEDYRQEGSRRMWDDFSPPYFRAKKGPNDSWMQGSEYLYTSESFALDGIKQYWAYWSNRISNTDPAHSRWSAYCSIYFTDEDADGRQDSTDRKSVV